MADAMDVRLARLKELEALEAQGSDETSSEEDDDTSGDEEDELEELVRLRRDDELERLRAEKAERDKKRAVLEAGPKMVTATRYPNPTDVPMIWSLFTFWASGSRPQERVADISDDGKVKWFRDCSRRAYQQRPLPPGTPV